MRRRPADVEEVREHGVATSAASSRLVARVRVALVAGHEARAHHDPRGARGERGERRRRVGDPARREQRQGHRAADLGQQRESPTTLWTWPPASTPCTISASARRSPPPGPRPPRRPGPAHARRRRGPGEQIGTETERERHPRRPLLDRHLKALVLGEVEHEVHAERTVRGPRDRADLLAEHRRAGSTTRRGVPRPPAVDTAMASRSAAPRPSGACISRSQPSALIRASVQAGCRACPSVQRALRRTTGMRDRSSARTRRSWGARA